MAAPSYTTDLTPIIENITSTTGWTALGGGASGLGVGADFAMQGSNAVDKQITAAEKGMVYNGSATLGASDHIFVWLYLATAGLADTLQNRGLTVAIGSATNAYTQFHVEGNDTYGAAGRVGKCYPIRYVNTQNLGGIPYRTNTGSPTTTPSYFGALTNQTATVKGANLGISAIRYGTGAYITAGDSGQPITLSGFNALNDAIANRWGILTLVAGSYELQGRFVIGQNNAGTATLAYFDDSDKNIVIANTPHSQTDFTQIIIDHASTIANLTNISITALGTNNRGKFVVNNASTDVNVVGGTWTGMGAISLQANSSINGTTLRQTDAITLNGGTLTNAVIDKNTAAIAVFAGDLNQITGCSFVSDGTGHAIELTTVAASTTMTWNNDLSGYASTDGATGNEAIKVAVADNQTLTINVSGGTTPSIYNASTGNGAVVVSASVPISITVVDGNSNPITDANVRIEQTNGTLIAQGAASAGTNSNEFSSSYGGSTPLSVRVKVRSSSGGTRYVPVRTGGTIQSSTGLSTTVTMQEDMIAL